MLLCALNVGDSLSRLQPFGLSACYIYVVFFSRHNPSFYSPSPVKGKRQIQRSGSDNDC